MYFSDPKLGNYTAAALKTIQKINYTVITVITRHIQVNYECNICQLVQKKYPECYLSHSGEKLNLELELTYF